MPIRPKSCFEITCDNEETDPSCDGGWDEGALHFETEEAAVETARSYGFVIVGSSILCASCARTRDCQRLDHKWDDWTDGDYLGVAFKRRHCDHCGASEYSPEFQQAVLLSQLRDIVDNAGQAVERDG